MGTAGGFKSSDMCKTPFQSALQSNGQTTNRAVRFVERTFPFRRQAVEFLGPAAALRSGFAGPGFDESLLLQPVEPGVNRADGDILLGLAEQLLADRGAVGAIVEPQDHQQQNVLEASQKAIGFHYNCSVVVKQLRCQLA